jgi:hypothetical protein
LHDPISHAIFALSINIFKKLGMKFIKKNLFTALTAGLILAGCASDGIKPQDGQNSSPELAGGLSDPHPALDSVCGPIYTAKLMSESGFSLTVNKCNAPGGVTACTTTIPWGTIDMYNGLDFANGVYNDGDDIGYFVANFSIASSWYLDLTKFHFSVGNDVTFVGDVPEIQSDWTTTDVNPLVNKFQLRVPMSSMPTGGFDVYINATVVKLNLFSQVINGSSTSLWGFNPDWNSTTSPFASASGSKVAVHYTPVSCSAPVWPAPQSECVAVYAGNTSLVNNAGCATLIPDVTGATGTLTYAWSSGETTPSLNVCPTANTTYTVSVSDNGAPFRVIEFNTNVINAACGNGNGNNGLHKVTVCHVPPGNPSNVQNICIDWSGVPAHVERFRDAKSNPNQGHDSGCEIGTCGTNPCLQ